MSWAVTTGTRSRRRVAGADDVRDGEVYYSGVVPAPLHVNHDPMVWDPSQDNLRPKTAAELLADAQRIKRSETKTEAYRRIVALAPEWRQRNMLAQTSEFLEVLAGGGTLTTEQEATQGAIREVWQAVKQIRAASTAIEDEIDALTDVDAVLAVDVAAHSAWEGGA